MLVEGLVEVSISDAETRDIPPSLPTQHNKYAIVRTWMLTNSAQNETGWRMGDGDTRPCGEHTS